MLQMEMDVLSLDVLAQGHIFSRYSEEARAFLDRGGIISWGITPTLTKEFERENMQFMIKMLERLWGNLGQQGSPREHILKQAWLAPVRNEKKSSTRYYIESYDL